MAEARDIIAPDEGLPCLGNNIYRCFMYQNLFEVPVFLQAQAHFVDYRSLFSPIQINSINSHFLHARP